MSLTQISTGGIKNATIKNEDIEADTIQFTKLQEMATNHIVGRSTSGTGNPEVLGAAQVRTILNVADGATASAGTTINNNADNRVITGSGTANTLNGESTVTINHAGHFNIGAATSHFGINLAQGDYSINKLGWSDASSNKRASIACKASGDVLAFFMGTDDSEKMRLDSSGHLLLGTTTKGLTDYGDSFTIADANAGMTLRCAATNQVSHIYFADGTSSDAQYRGYLQYHHNTDHMSFATSATERMRIQSNGNVMIGNSSHFTSNVAKLDVVHAGANTAPTYISRFFQETNNQGTDHATVQLRHAAAISGQTAVMVDFKNSAGNSHGSIKMGPSSVTFNTTSDYRMKENIVSLTNGITRLKQLIPKRFNFINDTTKTVVDGFFAHEVSPVVPEAISGTKDKVDSDGNPEYQSIDQSKLVPLLVAALQEAIGRIETLEAA